MSERRTEMVIPRAVYRTLEDEHLKAHGYGMFLHLPLLRQLLLKWIAIKSDG
jgi:hypothetical protein